MTKKSVKTMMIVLAFLAIGLYFVAGTYARYTAAASGTGTVQVAKWAVKIGEKDATQENTTFDLSFNKVENENVVNGYIAPGSQLYADFKIDPTGSQVAIDYSFSLGNITASEGTVPTTVKVLKVVPVKDNVEQAELSPDTGGKYTGKISLPSKDKALTADEAVTIRVYLEWENTNTAETDKVDTLTGVSAPTLTMTVNATATQSI